MDEQQFTKEFNAGHLLCDHRPELMDALIKGIQGNDELLEGMKEGSKQRENELERERIKTSIEKGKEQGKDNERQRGR